MASPNNYKPIFHGGFLLLFFFVILGVCVVKARAQSGSIAEKFLRIIPGESTRKDVEKIFPETKSEAFLGKHNVDFQDGEIEIGVEYSIGRCGAYSEPDFGKFPEWTVIEVWYTWSGDERIPLKDIILNRKRFKKKPIGHVPVHRYYIEEETGIEVIYDTKRKTVIDIFLKPAAKFKEKKG